LIPIPFSRGIFIVGPPLWVPKHLSPDDIKIYRKRLEQLLLEVTREADKLAE
jgi:lysophospholipid acyltransferase (LPLAT)-like uncharacterized protein